MRNYTVHHYHHYYTGVPHMRPMKKQESLLWKFIKFNMLMTIWSLKAMYAGLRLIGMLLALCAVACLVIKQHRDLKKAQYMPQPKDWEHV